MQMLYVAKKYQVASLILKCITFMEKNITCENACVLLEGAHTYSEPALKNTILTFIEDNAVEVLRSFGVKYLCYECLGCIMDSDDLSENFNYEDDGRRSGSRSGSSSSNEDENDDGSGEESVDGLSDENEEESCDEIEDECKPHQRWVVDDECDENCPVDKSQCDHGGDNLFPHVSLEITVCEAMLYWVNNECKIQGLDLYGENRRKVAVDLRHKVRYNLLDADYIICRLTATGILTTEERFNVFEYLLCKDAVANVFWKTDPRGPHHNTTWIDRFSGESTETYMGGTDFEAISFMCYEDMYLHGFSLYGVCFETDAKDSMFSITAKVFDESDGKFIAEKYEDYYDPINQIDDCFQEPDEDTQIGLREGISKYKDILFHRKVKLHKNHVYVILVQKSGPCTYCGDSPSIYMWAANEGRTYSVKGSGASSMNKIGHFEDYEGTDHHGNLYDGNTDRLCGQIPRLGLSPVEREESV